MRKKLSTACLLLAWLCANGVVLDAVQVVAWSRMFTGYLETMNVGAALRETFNPAKPCELCVSVAKAQETAQKQLPAGVERTADKLVLACEAPAAIVFDRKTEDWPAVLARAVPLRTDPVPLPPPARLTRRSSTQRVLPAGGRRDVAASDAVRTTARVPARSRHHWLRPFTMVFLCFRFRLHLPVVIATGAGLILAFAGCSRDDSSSATAKASREIRAHHDLRGKIVGVVVEKRRLVVHHEEIPNYMPAMTMEFKVGDADLASFQAGQKISARMIDEKSGDFRLEGIRLLDPAKDRAVDDAARQLQEDTSILGKAAFREIGEAAPRFSLYDQEGNVVSFDRLRGKRVVLNFVFTRCPVATMCPAATERMVTLQRLARERRIADLHLLSISLDPVHDTPPVLKTYARAYGIDPANFSLLTGPEKAVLNLLIQFGVLREPGDTVWKHSLATVLIDANGRIAHRVIDSTWDPEEFLKRL